MAVLSAAASGGVVRSALVTGTVVVACSAGAELVRGVAATAVGYGFDESRLILTVPAGLAGALLVFFGTGSLTEGWRTLKNEFDAASLYGWSARDALGRRLLWPLLGTGLLSGIGVVLAGSFHRELLSGALWVAAVSLLALTALFFQTMRNRDIPVEFLAPTVIPRRSRPLCRKDPGVARRRNHHHRRRDAGSDRASLEAAESRAHNAGDCHGHGAVGMDTHGPSASLRPVLCGIGSTGRLPRPSRRTRGLPTRCRVPPGRQYPS